MIILESTITRAVLSDIMMGKMIYFIMEQEKDVYKRQEQIIALKIVDKNGKEVYPTQYVKVEVGKTRKITLPKFSGYYPKNKKYNMTLKGTQEGNTCLLYTSGSKKLLSIISCLHWRCDLWDRDPNDRYVCREYECE